MNLKFDYKKYQDQITTENYFTVNGTGIKIYPFTIKLAGKLFSNIAIRLDPWADKQIKDNIGIGFFEDNVLKINYPKQKYSIY